MKGDHIGEFEELVLLAIHGLGAGAYGLAVHQLLERETTRPVSLGAVYAALDRLEDKGLLRSAMTDGTPVRGGQLQPGAYDCQVTVLDPTGGRAAFWRAPIVVIR